ncbi:MAG: BON domain-containing protein [Verrucomicrobia bacterium]|nr:MAG: BON domain-containing protein [Verrucomicrobiota bacterium]
MKKYFQSGIILVLILWLLGVLVYLPTTEGKLQEAAKLQLAGDKSGVFAKVKVEFSGQQAILSGAVATAAEKAQAQTLIENQLHLPGWFTANMNPVSGVTNDIAVDPEHAPFRAQPWLILTLFGGDQRLDGLLPAAAQREQLIAAIASKLPPPTTPLNNQIAIAATALPAIDWDATQTEIPDLTSTSKSECAIAVSACDGKWSRFPVSASNAEIGAALAASKVPANEITHALAKVRAWKELTPEELKQQAEQAAAAKTKSKPAAPNKNLGPFKGPNGGAGPSPR